MFARYYTPKNGSSRTPINTQIPRNGEKCELDLSSMVLIDPRMFENGTIILTLTDKPPLEQFYKPTENQTKTTRCGPVETVLIPLKYAARLADPDRGAK